MSDYICDDSLDSLKLLEDVRNMTEEEFEKFQKEVQEKEDFPTKYYLN